MQLLQKMLAFLAFVVSQEAKRAQLEWLHNEVQARYDHVVNRMAPGGWDEITALFNERFGVQKSKRALTKWYTENLDTSHEEDIRWGSLTAKEMDWLMQTAEERRGGLAKMPVGAWKQIAADFKVQFGFTKPEARLQEIYVKARKEAGMVAEQ